MPVIDKHFGPDAYIMRLNVDEEDEGIRFDQFVQKQLISFSREEIKRRILLKEITVESRSHHPKASTKLQIGEIVRITIVRTTQEDEYWRGEKIKLQLDPDILFEDQDLLVISKPAYMSTHPAGKHIFNCATVYFENIHQRTIHSIHRLDRETSGVLLLAKNPQIAAHMTDHFERDRVQKCYFFIARDLDKKQLDSFDAHERLGPKEEGLKRVHVHAFDQLSGLGKHASTSFIILHREAGYVLGLAFPKTGRQHQIRVHAQTHGYPLIGDKIYYGSYEMFQRFKDGFANAEDHDHMELPRHALHAIALHIPYHQEMKIFRSGLPFDLKEWIEQKMSCDLTQIEKKIEKEVLAYFKTD